MLKIFITALRRINPYFKIWKMNTEILIFGIGEEKN